ncbi:MAG: alpha/beta hydrolase [Gammaproteobacteria bacterium]|nr:alpha/beta hydrolase [Gammaproteobacteria bacterium]NIR82513.1 alpha/beta hydrolase [Gammaproteobacteria bacterium]NIU03644.1 alpha/beta hydrolase [Gammaproteobacteria bacterium]NIX84918.1 alpha/beta hydrolase [Gammaproteobacteria bacterium]
MPESLFVVTNRHFKRDRKRDSYVLEDGLNRNGAKELRLFEARPASDALEDWHLDLIPDKPGAQDFQNADVEPIGTRKKRRGSDLVAARVVRRLRESRQNLLLFIHGYNNTAVDAFRRAWRIAGHYALEVVVFTWPANGGGERLLEDLHGKASYKSDKSDARASTEALDRALFRMQALLKELSEGVKPQALEEAREAHPGDPDQQRETLVRLLRERACPFNVSLLAHSMGNYLYKKTLMTSSERLSVDTAFDNVILKAADANHEGHKEWVRRIRARRRVYITVNQNDAALQLSTMKVGEDQKPRLGNTLAEQNAANARYIDFTPYVDDRHSYFDETDLGREEGGAQPLTDFFKAALNGEIAEWELPYHAGTNTYRIE